MRPRTRLILLTTLACASVAAIVWVWIAKHEVLWPALVGTVPLLKKFLTWKALVVGLKKLPWFLVAGLKKYVLKIVGSLTTLHVGMRFPWVNRQIVTVKQHATKLLERVRTHWQTCSLFEKILIVLFSTALAILALVLIFLSKSLQLLTLRKGSESTAEQLIKRSVPRVVDKKIKTFTNREGPQNEESDG